MAKNKIEIPKLILDHLLQYGDTSILGLGTLFFENKSAYLSDDKSKIFPPSNSLNFSENINDTEQFVHYVANRLGVKKSKASAKVDKYAQQLLNKLLNYGEADIKSIGKLSTHNGAKVKFTKFHGEVNSEFFGLTPVELNPIQHFKKGNAQSHEMAVSTADMLTAKSSENSTYPKTTTHSEPSYNYNDDEDSNWIKPLFWIFGLVLLLSLAYKGCELYTVNKSNKSIDSKTIGTVADKQNSDTREISAENIDSNSNNNKIDDELNVTSKAPTECVIILGAYESAKNAIKMSTKLTKLGYTPYEEYFDTMDVTRVGFKFDCSEKDLQYFMREVRKEIAPDAWYLLPRITVE